MTYIGCKTHCNECGIVFIIGVKAPHKQARELHHIYFRSQYFGKDRNQKWNVLYLCPTCHRDNIHGVHGLNKALDNKLKAWADIQKPHELRNKEKIIIKKRADTQADIVNKIHRKQQLKQNRDKYIEHFKKNNNGLSPTQLTYRKNKEYKEKLLQKSKINL